MSRTVAYGIRCTISLRPARRVRTTAYRRRIIAESRHTTVELPVCRARVWALCDCSSLPPAPPGSDKAVYVAHGLAHLNEIRTWCVVRQGGVREDMRMLSA